MNVRNEIKVYDLNGSPNEAAAPVAVESHGKSSEFVVLVVHDVRITVLARELKAAAENATNVARWP